MPVTSSALSGSGLLPLWIAVAVIFALFISASAGFLARLNGDSVAAAILKAGGAFAATITVEILILGLFPALHLTISSQARQHVTR